VENNELYKTIFWFSALVFHLQLIIELYRWLSPVFQRNTASESRRRCSRWYRSCGW